MTPVRLRYFVPIVILVSGYAYGSVRYLDLPSGRRSGFLPAAGDLSAGAAEESSVEYVDNESSLEPLYDFLIQHRLHKLCKLLRQAQLEDILLDTGPLTIFAPTDGSFAFLPGGTLEEIQRSPQWLRDFILRHIVAGDVGSEQIQDELVVTSLQGSPLRFNIYGSGQVYTVSGAQILNFDLPFQLGRLHIIDHPLYLIPEGNIVDYLQTTHSQLYRLLLSTGLVELLSGGTYTIFAPDDGAFGYLSQDFLDILHTNRTLAERILLNHVLHGSVYTRGITSGMQLDSVGGAPLTFTESRGLTFVNGVPIVSPDIPVMNGVIHIINRVLLPDDIDTGCHCKSSSSAAVSNVQGTPSRTTTGGQVGPRQPQVPGTRVGTVQQPRPTGQAGQPGTPGSPYGPGRPRTPGSSVGTGSDLRPGSQPVAENTQRPGRPSGGSQRPGGPVPGSHTQRPGGSQGETSRPGSLHGVGQVRRPGVTPGRENAPTDDVPVPGQRPQEPIVAGHVQGDDNLPQDGETQQIPGDNFVAGQPLTPGTPVGTWQAPRPGSSFGTEQPQTPGSISRTGSIQRPGSPLGTGQPETPDSPHAAGSPRRPGSSFGTGQPQVPGSTFGAGQGQRPGSHPTKGQTQRRRPGQHPGSAPASGYLQRPGSEIRDPQIPGSGTGQPQRPGSTLVTGLPPRPGSSVGQPQRPGSPVGQPQRPGSSVVTGQQQRPENVLETEFPGDADENGHPQIPEGTFETSQPQRPGSISRPGIAPVSPNENPDVPGRTKINKPGRIPLPPPPTRAPVSSRTRTIRYPGSQQREITTPVAPQDDVTQFGGPPAGNVRGPYRPTRAPPTAGVSHGSRYPVPGTHTRVTPIRRPQDSATYPDSPQDSVTEVPDQELQPGRHRTPQPPRRITPRPSPFQPTQRPPVGQLRPVPTRAPVSRPIPGTTNCRQPGDRITASNRNFPLCSTQDVGQEPCQSLDQPYDPSDPRPACPGPDLDQGCRDPLQEPAIDDRRPACRIPQRKPDCRKYNEPRDNRPLCPGSTRNCRLPEEPENPLTPLPLCQETFAVEGCRRPDDPYDPQDRRPECPPDDCRPPQEPLRPGDTRPLCTVNEEDSIRQPLVPTTAKPRYPQQPRPGSPLPPQTPGAGQSTPVQRPSQGVTPIGSRPQTPSWQRPQTQTHSPRRPPGTEPLTTRKPGKQPVQPVSPDDNDALISPVENPLGRPVYPGPSQSHRRQGQPPPDINEPSSPQSVDRGTAPGQPQVPDQRRPGRPHTAPQRPSGQGGIPQTTPQRPSLPGGLPHSTAQRPSGQGGIPQTTPQRPLLPGGLPQSTAQRPSGQGGIPQTIPQRPSLPGGLPHSTAQRPSSQTGRPYPGQRQPSSPGSPSAAGPGGDDSARSLLDIVQDPGLQIKGHPVKLTIVLDLFQRAGLVHVLEGPGPATVFLPSDDAFKKLPRGVVEQLGENPDLLRQVLLYHIVSSEVRPTSQETSIMVPTLQGMTLVITMLKEGKLILIGGAKAVAVTRASNGIFYVINELLYPLPHEDIVSALKTRPDLTQVTSLIQQSGLTNMLTGSNPFTLFAPTDAAFGQLPEGTLQALTRNNTAIQELLLGHIVEGAHFGREFLAGGVFPNARGGKLRFKVLSYGYTVNDANIKTPEIVTGTGVIHLVDQVLVEPEDLPSVQGQPQDNPTGDVNVLTADVAGNYENYPEIADLARGMGLNQFLSWITNTGLIEKVHDGGSYTILAPTDAAVNSLPNNMAQAIDSDPDQVRPLLKFHIITQHIDLNNIRNEQTVSTLLPDKRIRFNVYQDGQEQVITACGVPINQAQGSGSVRLIAVNQALYPPSGNLAQVLEASPILQNLAAAIRSFHLSWMLNGQGPTTIFAPSDAAFEALSDDDRKNLIENRQAFTDLLKRHIVKRSIFSAGIQDGMQVRNEKRETVTFSVHPGGISVNSIPISYSDVTATNGVLHVIDHFL